MVELFYRFGTAGAIGFLIGLQRESVRFEDEAPLFGGVRTFALIAILGCGGAMLAESLETAWGFVVPAASVAVLIAISYRATSKRGHLGLTTEVAGLVVLVIGALCYEGQVQLAVALGVVTMMLLSAKVELQRFTRSLTREDFVALVKFGLVTAVILPVLPATGFGPPPFDVLVPYNVWLMVVLISGLSFLGYAVIKFAGPGQGIALTGFLGGLAASTAVTLTFSERSKSAKGLSESFGIAILIAWVTMFARVLVEVGVVNRALVTEVWGSLVAAGVAGGVYCGWLFRARAARRLREGVEFSNPFRLSQALRFGALYAAILLVARYAQMQLGDQGIYLSSVAAGLTDVDAITLSLAELSQPGGELDPTTAGRAVTLAAMSNTVVKAGIVLMTGSADLRKAVGPGFLLMLTAGLLTAFLL